MVLLVVFAVLTAGTILGTAATWDRPRLRRTRRIAGLATSQLLMFAVLMAWINRQNDFLPDLSQVFGGVQSALQLAA